MLVKTDPRSLVAINLAHSRTFGSLSDTNIAPRSRRRILELINFVGWCGGHHQQTGSWKALALHRHQALPWLLEFLRPFSDGLCLAGRFNIAEPHGLGAKDQDGPTEEGFRFSCQIRTKCPSIRLYKRRKPLNMDGITHGLRHGGERDGQELT